MSNSNGNPPSSSDVGWGVWIFLLGLAGGIIYLAWLSIRWMTASGVTASTLQTFWGKLVIAIVLLVAALLLAVFRWQVKPLYGIIEVAFGVAISWKSMDSLGQQLASRPELN